MNRFLAVAALFLAVAARADGPRVPQAANRFYPADAKLLAQLMDRVFAAAGQSKAAGSIVALIVPHAGVEYSGATAAKAYALVSPGQFDRVIVVGTGHY